MDLPAEGRTSCQAAFGFEYSEDIIQRAVSKLTHIPFPELSPPPGGWANWRLGWRAFLPDCGGTEAAGSCLVISHCKDYLAALMGYTGTV